MADQTTTSTTSPASFLLPYYQNFLNQAQTTAQRPFQQYEGPRVAQANPYMTGAANAFGTAQSGGMNVTPGTNQYAGMNNPYLQQSIKNAQQDVATGYNMLQAPAWASAMRNSGSFGNSGIQESEAYDRNNIAKQQAQIAQNMRMQDYTQQQQLAENAVNRNLSAGQFNSGLQMQGAQGALTAGNTLRGIDQAGLDSNVDKFNAQWNYPLQQLDILGNALRTGMGAGSTSTSVTPVSTNKTGQWLGGLTALSGLLSKRG